jgi:hypothetical protein
MAVDWEAEVGEPTTALFGSAATYFPGDGSPPFGVVGVFDEGYREVVIIDSLSYTSDAQPVIGITDGQFAAWGWKPAQNDKVLIQDPLAMANGKTFIVKEVRPDSHGITKLMLNEWIGSA